MDKKLYQFITLIVMFTLTIFEWRGVSASTASDTRMQEHYAGITVSTTYYVSTTGNDANSGSSTSPFKTFTKAVSVLKPGDTLQVMPGIYGEPLKISISGTVDAPITIIGNSTILDMQGVNSKGIDISGSYIHVSGFEVIGATQFGINATGKNIIVENNKVHDTVTENGVGTCGSASSHGSAVKVRLGGENIIIRNNTVYNNCGEGIAITRGISTLVANNIVYDNFGVNLYVDNSPYTTVRSNISYCTGTHLRNGRRATGITLGEEFYSGWGAQLHDILVSGNTSKNCYIGVSAFQSQVGGTLTNVTITQNNIPSGESRSISIDTLANQNVLISYNVLFKNAYVSPLAGVTLIGNTIGSIAIFGNAGTSGVTLSYFDGVAKSVASMPDGTYSLPISNNWTGTVTPSHPCFTFSPSSSSYSNVTANQNQNYIPAFKAGSGCADIDVTIGGVPRGEYGLLPQGSQRVTYALDSGPVKVESTNAVNLIAALRDAWLVNGQVTSFAQLMGLPKEQLSDTYYFPAYDNLTLSGQLRIANVDTVATDVTVTIAGIDRGTYHLNPNESVRPTYALDAGPVVVKSSGGAKIIAALRDAWLVKGQVTSFAQLMGLPKEKLSDTYYFPAYNNVSLSGQLRIGNVDTVATDVTVTIAGIDRGTYHLNPNESVRPTFPLDAGPVVVKSSGGVKIIAALRDAWLVNGQVRSSIQLMGLPDESLSNTYYFPAYNNVSLSGQLRIGNVDTVATDVTVTIAGIDRGTYHLNPNESVRPTFPLDAGPVVVKSSGGVKIIAALRDAWLVNGQVSSFAQLMGLPKEALSTVYYFPAYNNLTLSEQLRFGVTQ